MQTYLIDPPTQDVVSLAVAKSHLRITGTTQDAAVTAMRDAAVAELDAASNGWLGRALRPQTWEVRFDACDYRTWTRRRIELPFPPLLSVTSIKYDDTNGDEQTFSTASYRVLGVGSRGKGAIEPIYAETWPDFRIGTEALRVRYECGYDDDVAILPPQIKAAVLLGMKSLWDLQARDIYLRSVTVDGSGSTSWAVSDAGREVMRTAAQNLLSTLKVWD